MEDENIFSHFRDELEEFASLNETVHKTIADRINHGESNMTLSELG